MTKPRARRVCTTLSFLANGFGMGAWSVEIAEVQARTGASDFAIGMALLGFAIAALAAMQVSERLSARFPVNRLCAAFGIAFACALAALGLMPNVATLAVALAFFGMAHGALDVAMNARASVLENRSDRPIMSSFHAAWSIGGGGGAVLAGLLTGAGFGSALVLPAAAAVALPGLILAGGGHQPPTPIAAATDRDTGRARAVDARRANPRLIALCAIAFLALMTEGALANWSSIYLKSVLAGLSGGFAVGYVAFSCGMSVGRVSGDRIIQRLGRRATGTLGALIAAIAFAAVLAYPTYASACVGFALIGLGMSNVIPITFSIAGRAARSEAVGIARAASSGYTGFVVGAPVIGGLANLSSLPAALTLLIASTLLITLCGLYAFRPHADGLRAPLESPPAHDRAA